MADNSENILQHLQQYSVQPPAGAFDKAWEAIVQQRTETITRDPSSENMEQKIFNELQQYSLAAPALDFTKFKKDKNNYNKRTYSIPLPLLRIASVLIVIAAGLIFYLTVMRKKNTGSEYANNNANQPGVVTKNTADSNLNTSETSVLTNEADAKNTTSGGPSKRAMIAGNGIFKRSNSSKISFSDGSEAKLYENDVLLTLTSYNSNDWQQFFSNAVKDKRITLNEYSYMNLSDKMVEMLQQTYLTKKNGSSSRKSKRTKKKFEKWRKSDEKYFDKNMQKNPADINDLVDFIL